MFLYLYCYILKYLISFASDHLFLILETSQRNLGLEFLDLERNKTTLMAKCFLKLMWVHLVMDMRNKTELCYFSVYEQWIYTHQKLCVLSLRPAWT